jgi:hypothetical protein
VKTAAATSPAGEVLPVWLAVRFVVHQARDVVLLRKSVDEFLFVLADTPLQ